jgi:hypothetical protein
MLDTKNVVIGAAIAAVLIAIGAYVYMSQPSTVAVAPGPAPTQQAK